jgi:hypothetical protein
VTATLLVPAAAVLALHTWDIDTVRTQARVDAASRAAPSAAKRSAAAILAYDHESLDADEKAAERYLTAKCRAVRRHFDTLVRPNAAKVRGRVEARPRPARPTGESPSWHSTGCSSRWSVAAKRGWSTTSRRTDQPS